MILLERILKNLIKSGDLYDHRFKSKRFSAKATRKLKDYHIRDINPIVEKIHAELIEYNKRYQELGDWCPELKTMYDKIFEGADLRRGGV